MQIQKLTLVNFRKFIETDIEFHPEFNVLVGENASGKTAILEAIALAINPYFQGMMTHAKNQSNKLRFQNDDVRSYRENQKFVRNFPSQIQAVFHTAQGQRETTVGRDSKEKMISTAEWKRCGSEMHSQKVDRGINIACPVLAYYSTNRTPRAQDKPTRNVKNNSDFYISEVNSIEDTSLSFFNWFAKMEGMASQKYHEQARIYQMVKEAVCNMIPDCKEIRYDFYRDEIVVSLSGQNDIPFFWLSDGYRILLALVADTARRAILLNPDWNTDILSETSGIVLIDELDLHLHPKWQRTIVGSLRKVFPKIQFIVTTHSPLIISEVEPESVILLKDTENGFDWFHPEESFGQTSDALIEDIFEEKRYPHKIAEEFDCLFGAIKRNQLDEAKQRYAALEEKIKSDTELIRARILISRQEILGGKK